MLTLLLQSKVVLRQKILVSCLLCMVFSFLSVAKAVEIVVNTSVPPENHSLNEIRAIFAMRKRYWSKGEKIKVFTLADNHDLHRKFSKNNLNMFPHQLRRVWDRMVFSGTGLAPVELKTEQEMIETIANTKNAIGYLNNRPENEKIRLFVYH